VAVEAILERTVNLAGEGEAALRAVLDDVPTPVYVTDAHGLLTYFNPACVTFAGREPQVGRDRWCVTWRLYTVDGAFLPHDRCPMAEAIRTQRPVRGVTAMAERPDGARVRFQPHPTPIFGEDGAFLGAANILVDLSAEQRAETLADLARRYREAAACAKDRDDADRLARRADDYEARARAPGPEA
jgi:PAS domain S-box-containing protein